MKKIVFIFLAMVGSLYACVCAGDIISGFTSSKTHIVTTINQATTEIESGLIPALDKNIEDIKKQNEELKKLLVAYMQNAEQKREISFLLESITKIQ